MRKGLNFGCLGSNVGIHASSEWCAQDAMEIAFSTPCASWLPAPKKCFLAHNEIHVWRAAIDLKPAHVDQLAQCLAPDEQARAGRFYFQKDRARYVAARGLLRVILAHYLGFEPNQLLFCYNPYGKPALASPATDVKLCFNLTHSHGLALFAIARGREVGVDVERLEPDRAQQTIAERFFSPAEVKALRSLPPSLQPAAFFHCWTRKEAYIKARGKGLSIPLDQFDVSVAPGQPAALLQTHGDAEGVFRWSLRDLPAGPGYVAAIAAEGHDWHVKCWQWQDESVSLRLMDR